VTFTEALLHALSCAMNRGIAPHELTVYADRVFWFNVSLAIRSGLVEQGGMLSGANIRVSSDGLRTYGALITNRQGWLAFVEEA
jgi:hypothetical protein